MPTMRPIKNRLWTAGLLVLLAAGPLSAEQAAHDIRQIFGNMKHALGWDTLNLKVVEKDASGRPTLERSENSANKVERRVQYFPGGKRKSQTVTVSSRDGGKILTEEKKRWGTDGKLEHRFIRDFDHNERGSIVQGETHVKDYAQGKLIHEIKKRFQRDNNNWELLFEATLSYHDDGSMKERLREEPLKGLRAREQWTEKKSPLGRKKTTQKWDGASKSWQ